MHWNSESPSMPMTASTPRGSSVTVATTIRMVPDRGITKSVGYPTRIKRMTASTAFLGSSMPPRILPESV